jgi:L-ascorbate metabolism protein UlaG (beta-lactamase superfamily)
LTDPYAETLGLSMGRQQADIVTISHFHPHHSHYDGIEGNPRLLRGPGEYEIANFYVTGMGAVRNDQGGERSINTIFAIHCEGVTLCHLGDLNRELTSRQIDELSQTDVLFVPAGGVCTISSSQVARLVDLVAPRIVVPLHYRIEGVRADVLPLDAFLQDMGGTERAYHSRISVTASNLPRELRLDILERNA